MTSTMNNYIEQPKVRVNQRQRRKQTNEERKEEEEETSNETTLYDVVDNDNDSRAGRGTSSADKSQKHYSDIKYSCGSFLWPYVVATRISTPPTSRHPARCTHNGNGTTVLGDIHS